MSGRYLRFNDLVQRGILSNRTTLARWIRDAAFPAGIKIAANTRVWPESEIEGWIEKRRSAQPNGARDAA